jgi:hypothetical protein
VPLHTAVAQRTGGDHLGVEQGVAGQQTVEKPAMAVGPIHHGRYRKTPAAKWLIYIDFIFGQVLHLGRFFT